MNSASERRQSVLNARLRECARTRYARVRVRIGASIHAARCGIATEKLHVVGKSTVQKGKEKEAMAIAGEREREHRERESWSDGEGSIRPGQSVTMSLV